MRILDATCVHEVGRSGSSLQLHLATCHLVKLVRLVTGVAYILGLVPVLLVEHCVAGHRHVVVDVAAHQGELLLLRSSLKSHIWVFVRELGISLRIASFVGAVGVLDHVLVLSKLAA